MAVAWTGSTMNVDAAGTAVVSGSYDGGWNLTTIGIGTGCFCTVRNTRVYLAALPSSSMTTLTADAYEWLMPYRVAWLDQRVAANDDVFLKRANQ